MKGSFTFPTVEQCREFMEEKGLKPTNPAVPSKTLQGEFTEEDIKLAASFSGEFEYDLNTDDENGLADEPSGLREQLARQARLKRDGSNK